MTINKAFGQLLVLALVIIAGCTPRQSTEEQAGTKKEPIRGVWLTNVASKALYSRDSLHHAVDLIDSLGFNTIYVVTWNKAMTTYPSRVMEETTGVKIEPGLKGRDPLQELIDYAHPKGLRVMAWFEFGFASSYNAGGGILLEKHPEWKALNPEGQLVKKNNFEWMNSLHPGVQNFMLSLIMEVVRNYDVDGIQGDDRLPAMPSQGGYSDYTKKLYKKEHDGKAPPENTKDFQWVQWRAQKLNRFMKRLHDSIKSYDDNLVISMAPSVYPWSKKEYLQDWPVWVNKGLVDEIIPQLYRYDIEAYKRELDKAINWQVANCYTDKFYPGILLQVSDYNPSAEYLKKMVKANRDAGIKGEVMFFYEGLKKYPELFHNLYQSKP